ncbi:MAG: SDR family NAD(P)-dependent oxidoreductase [Acidimicrobiia bacterium]
MTSLDMRAAGPNGRLEGKSIIVTGAGHEGDLLGTGVAIALRFASEGAKVGIVDISAARAENTREKIAELGGDAVVSVADITKDDECARAVGEVVDAFGGLDGLVNNAGVAAGGTVVDIAISEWDRVLDINLKSAMLMSRYSIPAIVESGGGGIVNISSVAGMRAFGTASYAASKGGMIALTYDMAYAHGLDGVRVNCIAPGHVFTPMGNQGGDEIRDQRRRAGLLGTEGDAWDIANAALFLMSDEARWITGLLMPVDAGATVVTALPMMRRYSF